MPIHYKYKDGQKVLYAFYEGTILARDCFSFIESIKEDNAIAEGGLIVVDMSHVETVDIDYDQAIELSIEISKLHRKGLNQFLLFAPGANVFGIARMLQMLMEQDGNHCQVVKTEEEVNQALVEFTGTPEAV